MEESQGKKLLGFERVAKKEPGLSSATRDSRQTRQNEHDSVGFLFPYTLNRNLRTSASIRATVDSEPWAPGVKDSHDFKRRKVYIAPSTRSKRQWCGLIITVPNYFIPPPSFSYRRIIPTPTNSANN